MARSWHDAAFERRMIEGHAPCSRTGQTARVWAAIFFQTTASASGFAISRNGNSRQPQARSHRRFRVRPMAAALGNRSRIFPRGPNGGFCHICRGRGL